MLHLICLDWALTLAHVGIFLLPDYLYWLAITDGVAFLSFAVENIVRILGYVLSRYCVIVFRDWHSVDRLA